MEAMHFGVRVAVRPRSPGLTLLIEMTNRYCPSTMVWRRHPAEREFIAALATIDLPKSYDAQVGWDSEDGEAWEGTRGQFDGVLAGVEPSPRYYAKERFFRITSLELKSYLHLSWYALAVFERVRLLAIECDAARRGG